MLSGASIAARIGALLAKDMKSSLSERLDTWRTNVVILFGFALGLCALFAAMWAALEVLRRIGAWLFIDASLGPYVRLDSNSVINVLPNNLLVLFYLLLTYSVLSNAWQVFRRPWRGGRKVGAQREEARRQLRRFAVATPVVLLLCLPGMNTYTIVTPTQIVQKRFFALHAESYPLGQVTKVQCTVAGRGLIFTELTFSDGRSLEEAGFHPRLMTAIAHVGGVNVEYDRRCRSEFGIDDAARLSAPPAS